MAAASSGPQNTTAYLPASAYFGAGAGQACDVIRKALVGAGFDDIAGPSDSQRATQLWITPPGQRAIQISPPGTDPKKAYDLDSLITLVGTDSAPRRA